MADEKAMGRLQAALNSLGGAADWNNFRTQCGPVDLKQAVLERAELKDYNFSRCDLTAAKLFNADLAGADFTEGQLSYIDLRRANLSGTYMTRCNLQVAQLQGANLVDANLEMANMRSTNCGGAYLVGANLAGADLTGADLRGANLKFANLTGTIVQNTKIEDADLTGVKLTREQISAFHHFDQAIIRQKPAVEAGKKRMAAEDAHDDLFQEADCYRILGVPPEASLEDLDKAYRKRVKEYHPDRVNMLGEKLQIVAQREFQRIQHAYHSLTHHRSKPAAAMGATGVPLPRSMGNDPASMTIEDLLTVLESNPTNESAHYNLGIKYFEHGLVDLAIKAYEQALALNPNNSDAAYNLKLAKLAQTLSQ